MTDPTPQEYGAPHDPAKPVDPKGQPRGDAMFPVPHVEQFAGLVNTSGRLYYDAADEAMRNNPEHARIMRLDPVIDACMRLLTYPVALLPNHVDPDDDTDPAQVEASQNAERLFSKLPGMLYAKRWLLDQGTFTGKAGVKVRWEWVPKRGRTWMMPTALQMVSGDKLVYKWDGSVGIRVSGTFRGPTINDGRTRVYMLSPEEREQLVVHNFEPEDAHFWQPRAAGAIHGCGLRDKLYWLWALKSRIWALGVDFLQWFAQGLTAYYFEHGNEAHYLAVKDWVEKQHGRSALLFPRMKDGGPGYKPIERFEAGTASSSFIQQLITEYFDELIRQIIVGQTLTSGTAATGLGSGVAAAHQDTFDIRVKYHAVGLGETLTRDLLVPWYAANYPGMPAGRWVLEVDNPNVQQMIENAQVLYGMGGRIPEDALLEAIGLPEVKPGDTILAQVAPMQPAAVDGMPEGVPVMTGQDAPIKMSRRAFANMVQLARREPGGKVWRYAVRNRSRFVVDPGRFGSIQNAA
jgi:hypothetical protein